MEGHHLRQHQIQQQQVQHVGVSLDASDSRFPQWSVQETKEFLGIRAELDPTFMETKRNKLLWELISNKMKEKGYNRSPDQCKFKWKNLVTRYKGCETMEPEAARQQFPFFNELQAIFAARMQRMLWAEAEGGGATGSGSKKKAHWQLSSDEEEENEDSDEGEKLGTSSSRKRKKGKMGTRNIVGSGSCNVSSSGNTSNSVREMLEEFMNKQIQMEMQWREMYEAREKERRAMELEWRQKMEALENDRLMFERRWREREEQRRIREEARAEKRDQLITALLNKLARDDS